MEYASAIGVLTVAEEDGSIVGLWIEGQKYFPDLRNAERRQSEALSLAVAWLDRYFRGERPSPEDLPLSMCGTEFQKEVWACLLRIPYGSTVTYAQIAAEIAQRRGIAHMSAQAVGAAVGHNPISIVVPCHRVLGSDGSLTGYAGGLERKSWLLEWESSHK